MCNSQDMLIPSDEGDSNDVFFDPVDCLSPQESALGSKVFDYDIWVSEPKSVKERRQRFLKEMGLSNISSKATPERVRDTNGGAVSNAPEESTLKTNNLFYEREGRPKDEADVSFQGHRHIEAEVQEEGHGDSDMSRKKNKNWWKRFVKMRSKLNKGANRSRRIKVRTRNKKSWMEFSGLYVGQEIRAHKGIIWTMKFSPNGKYLASGGEDGVVRVWRVVLKDTSSNCFDAEDSLVSKVKQDMFYSWKKQSSHNSIVLPNKIFQIEESPLQEFYGHSSDVLDLAWSNSDVS